MRRYTLDGRATQSLEQFAQQFSDRVLSGHHWHGSLDAFNDILRGGFGTPDEGFVLVWEHSEVSRVSLGYTETIRQLQSRLQRCHPANDETVRGELSAALQRKGPTVFDWLVEIIHDHGPGGKESEDNVILELR